MRRRIVIATLAFLAAVACDASADDEAAPKAPVRVSVEVQRVKDIADVFVERGGAWTLACRAPCAIYPTPGERVRIELQGSSEPPLVFTVDAEKDVEVRHRGEGLLVGGLVAFGVGALSLALGMAIIRGAGKDDLFGDANRGVANFALLFGAAAAVTGSAVIVTRSTKPFVEHLPTTRSQALEDLSPARSVAFGQPWSAPLRLVWTQRF